MNFQIIKNSDLFLGNFIKVFMNFFKFIFVWLSFSWVLVGCTYLGDFFPENKIPVSKRFTPRVTASKNAVPVPIELATDQMESEYLTPPPQWPPTEVREVVTQVPSHATGNRSPSGLNLPESNLGDPLNQKKFGNTGSSMGQFKSGPRNPAGTVLGKSLLQNYQIKPGDTLMKIAFSTYGDLMKWKDIFEKNKNLLSHYNLLIPGTMIVLESGDIFAVDKNGFPYLIKKYDTLIKISKNLYGTPNEWRSLWKNNPQLIQDPNKIYAGFTLYYQEKGP